MIFQDTGSVPLNLQEDVYTLSMVLSISRLKFSL
jgi:hypothetical protein